MRIIPSLALFLVGTSAIISEAKPVNDYQSHLDAGYAALDSAECGKARREFTSALDLAPSTAAEGRLAALTGLGQAAEHSNDFADAEKRYHDGLGLAPKVADRHLLGTFWYSYGRLLLRRKDIDKSLKATEVACGFLTQPRDKGTLSRCYTQLGGLYGILGRDGDAIQMFKKGITTSIEKGDPAIIFEAYRNQGEYLTETRSRTEGLVFYDKAFDEYKKFSRRRWFSDVTFLDDYAKSLEQAGREKDAEIVRKRIVEDRAILPPKTRDCVPAEKVNISR